MAATPTSSPAILDCEWGSVRVATADGSTEYKDAKLWPGGSRGWDWNETGTHHSPGIQPADVEELVEHGAEIVVLSQGQNLRLQVQERTVDWLEDRGVDVEILETLEAVDRYNELTDSKKVGALIHSTC
jgi:hypothetical protein